MDRYTIKAYAKINLGLDIIGKLENGYHEVSMVMQSVGIYDELSFIRKPGEGITLKVLFPDAKEGDLILSDVPGDERNIVYKAAKLMYETYSIKDGIEITLKKRIPSSAGMAGGSTDAAATLKAINRIFELDCSVDELMDLGVKLGADVPFCVMGGTALAEGIGEKLTALNPAPACSVLIVKPHVNISTKAVYETFDNLKDIEHPDIPGMVNAINAGRLMGVLDRMGNVLSYVTEKDNPEIPELKDRLKKLGAVNSMMSGSGPTVFGLFIDIKKAKEGFEKLKDEGLYRDVFLTDFIW